MTHQAEVSLFGVPLTAEATALLHEVEQLYGKTVGEEWLAAENPDAGMSKVSDDGTPVIYINRTNGRRLDVVVHELYHFILRSRGYPVVKWLYPDQLNAEANRDNRDAVNQMRQQFYDTILHLVMYPEVAATLGINAGEGFEDMLRERLDDGSLASQVVSMDSRAVALLFFKIRVEVSDTGLLRRLRELLEQGGKREGIELGDQLARIVQQPDPPSPAGAIDALVECLNKHYQGEIRFRQHSWQSRQLGEHIQQIAPIELTLLR